MSQNYIRLFYVEMIALAVITVVFVAFLGAASPTAGSVCEYPAWRIIPYLYFHFDEVCGHGQIVAAIAAYYALSVLVIAFIQYLYLRGRKHLTIFDRLRFFLVALLIVFIFFAWILGRGSYNLLFSFQIHEPRGWGFYIIPIVLPSFQFILSILMIGERN